MTSNFRRRAAFAVAGVAAAAAMSVTLVGPAGARESDINTGGLPPTYHGAIAVGPHGAVGKSWDYPTRTNAENAALKVCGVTGCKVLSSFTRCGAVAHDGTRYQGGFGATQALAEDDAMTRLGGGRIVIWACN